jgi:molybdate/tungstate transport system ATP-binding protein
MEPSLKLLDVSISLGSFRLDSVSLSASRRDYLIIIGRTASGKTTLLKTIAGAYKAAAGKILLDGKDVNELPPERRNIAYVSQVFSGFEHMPVYGNIEFGLRVRKVAESRKKGLVTEIARDLGIEHLLKRTTRSLSGGEQQRVALARALVISPKVLLLDEPLSMIDPETKESILRLLKSIPEKYDIPVVHVTHDWDEAYALATRIAVMDGGRMIEVGEPDQIFSAPKSLRTAKFTGFVNVYSGNATPIESGSIVELKIGVRLKSKMSAAGPVHACIRPERVKLEGDGVTNALKGIVMDVLRERSGYRLILEVGGSELTAFAGRKAARGDTLTISIPEDAVHLIPDTGVS